MTGIPHHEDKAEKEKESRMQDSSAPDVASAGLNQPVTEEATAIENKALVAAIIKKRKLYKQLTGTEVPWFPHDNDMTLLKELCWETGNPRWVIHGTPAGGAGVEGCLEAGCSVVLLCFDDHHRTHVSRFIMERAVESMVTGTTLVFKEESLRARSIELNLTRVPASKADEKEKKDEQSEDAAKDKKAKKNDTKKRKETEAKEETPKKEARKKQKEESPDSSSSGGRSDSSSGRRG